MSNPDLIKNPYVNAPYRKSGWQSFLEKLGFRTGADAYAESMAVNAAEFEAQKAQMLYENEYNSPAEQAERMRVAGMNPDLQGVGDVASSASMEPDPNAPISPDTDTAQVVQFGESILNAVTGGIAIAKDITSLSGMSIENAGKLFGFTQDYILQHTPAEFASDEDYSKWLDSLGNGFVDVGADPSERLDSFRNLGLSRSQARRVQKHLGMIAGSLPTNKEQASQFLDYIRASKSGRMEQNSYWSASLDVWKDINEELIDFNKRVTRASAEGSALSAENAADYQGEIDPTMQAAAENAVNERAQQANTIQKEISSTLGNITSKLSKMADEGGWKSYVAQGILLMLNIAQMSMSVSSSSGSSKFGRSSSSSMSLGGLQF